MLQRIQRDQRSLGSFKATMNMGLGLDLDDVYLPGEPIAIGVSPEDEGARLTAVVRDAAKGTEVARITSWTEDGAWPGTELPPSARGRTA